MNTKSLARHIMFEAAGDEQINSLVEKAIETSLGAIDFQTLKSNFEQAKAQYYTAIRNSLADKLGVSPYEVGRFITSDMKKAFEDALQKNYEALQPTPDQVEEDFSDPQLLTEA